MKVFNGYVGTIVDVDDNYIEDGTIHTIVVVEYDNMNNLVTYKDAKIKALELAYVLTVHKSQGSEYPYVISPIHYEQKILLNRNLLYTDVTRAKKEFCLIGDERAVDLAISTEISDFERIFFVR